MGPLVTESRASKSGKAGIYSIYCILSLGPSASLRLPEVLLGKVDHVVLAAVQRQFIQFCARIVPVHLIYDLVRTHCNRSKGKTSGQSAS